MTVLRSGSATDVGRIRTTNEDLALDGSDLFAVADGMGGHAAGEVAARLAIETLANQFETDSSFDGLKLAVEEANTAVWHESQSQSALRGMGTTVIAAALVSRDDHEVIALANVGDSRAYLLSEGELSQVTLDHSLAEEKFRMGELTREQAEVHPQRHILTRALGVSSDVTVDVWQLELSHGDRLMLCSDGLTNELSSERLTEILASHDDPQEAADALVTAANQSGGNDNITVVLVDVVEDDQGDDAGTRVIPLETEDVGGGPSDLVVSGLLSSAALATGAVEGENSGVFAGDPSLTGVVPRTPGPATATTRTPEPLAPASAPQGGVGSRQFTGTPAPHVKESRGARRRRLGVPRRVTFRVVLFVLLVAGVVVAGYYFIRWYENDNYYVTVDHTQHIVIYRGRTGGILWFKPYVVSDTGVTTAQVLPAALPSLVARVQEPTLGAAKHYISNLQMELKTQQQQTATPSTGGVGPSGVLPSVPSPTTSAPTTTTVVSPAPPT